MTSLDLGESLEDSYETELARLGSSKALYAATHGDMEPSVVRTALAARFRTTADILDTWPTDEPTTVYESLASQLTEYETTLSTNALDPTSTNLADTMTTHDTPPARAGGLLAWALATDRLTTQAIGFFVSSGDQATADTLRGISTDLATLLDQLPAIVDTACQNDADWARATTAANRTLEAAYEDYVTSLEAMGVTVKPIC